MPTVNHVVTHTPAASVRVEAVRGMFDFTAPSIGQTWSVEIPDDSEPWSVGMIVGPSGSGKTQIARARWGALCDQMPTWDARAIVDAFPAHMKVNEICDLLSRVGLGSVPSWLLPYAALSNGQRFRADIARRIAEASDAPIIIDEFSSVVDRTVAKTTSSVVAKYIRQSKHRFVAVTCHYDVLEWLCPDWVLDMVSGTLARGSLQCRPKIVVDIRECSREIWRVFKTHHYLTQDLSRSARCFVAMIEDDPCAFCAVIPYPHKQLGLVYRIHRVVTLPDFQGMGIACALMAEVARTLPGEVYISTSHAPFARSLSRSPDWRMTRDRGFVTGQTGRNAKLRGSHRPNVISAGFQFVRREATPCV